MQRPVCLPGSPAWIHGSREGEAEPSDYAHWAHHAAQTWTCEGFVISSCALELGSTEPSPRVRMLLHGYWLQELAPAEALYVGPGRLWQLQPCQRRQGLKVNIPIQALLATT